MRKLTWLAVVPLVAIAIASPVSARVVRMETTVALADLSDQAVTLALRQALDGSVRAVVAMGLAWLCVDEARILSDAVVLRTVGTDEEPVDRDGEASASPDMCRRIF